MKFSTVSGASFAYNISSNSPRSVLNVAVYDFELSSSPDGGARSAMISPAESLLDEQAFGI
jgi:hypothetical protein